MLNNWRFLKINLPSLTFNLFKANVFVPSEYLRFWVKAIYLFRAPFKVWRKLSFTFSSLVQPSYSRLTTQVKLLLLSHATTRPYFGPCQISMIEHFVNGKKSEKRKRRIQNNFHHTCLIVF